MARYLMKCCFLVAIFSSIVSAKSGIVVFQSDFGQKDAAVSEVKGVMYSVDKSLVISDLTHEIPAYNIWEAAYRLYQAAAYWPKETVFVSVVDPGVGTQRRSIVALTNNGQYFVTPDNGSLTLIDNLYGIKEIRIIDESKNRLKGSGDSYTFFGRDVYGYTAAKLASGKISFNEVGPVSTKPVVRLAYQKPVIDNHVLRGTLVILDTQYGNVWTDIDRNLIKTFGIKANEPYQIKIYHNKTLKYSTKLSFHHTFGATTKGTELLYLNSLFNLAIAANQGNFAKLHQLKAGPDWTIAIEKIRS
ncbi:SAM hydrolase/SAM-dependent halogenase family protein [Legionella hackeliae]|nr:S-adenosyl-l-methionine hydroxide adenosyltransferase family protein [Legionella hackeliae]